MSRRPIKARDTRWAQRVATLLVQTGLTPNMISIASVGFAAMAGAALTFTPYVLVLQKLALYVVAVLGIQLRLLCNLFDGMVAVEGGRQTKSGEIFNELPDRFSDVAVLLGCGYAVGAHFRGPELGALACILALIAAYVRALGAAAGAGQCFLGPMAKPQRMAIVTVACASAAVLVLWDLDRAVLQLALAVVVVGCVVTLWRRTCWIVRQLEAR